MSSRHPSQLPRKCTRKRKHLEERADGAGKKIDTGVSKRSPERHQQRPAEELSPSPSPDRQEEAILLTAEPNEPLTLSFTQAEGDEPTNATLSAETPAALASLQESFLEQMREFFTSMASQQPGCSKSGSRKKASHKGRVSHRDHGDSESDSSGQESLMSGDEELLLSDGGEDISEEQNTSGLFRPSLFKTLLSKAKAVTFLSEKITPAEDSETTTLQATAQLLLTPKTSKSEEVPAPQLVTDTVHKQWEVPAAGKPPLTSEKRFYNLPAAFAASLDPPKVDDPVLALATSGAMVTDPTEALKPEDRRSEQTLRKGHLATAWAVKAASTASFFNRATLLWLKQLQGRVSSQETRLHQDINKIIAAVEFSADATLHASKYAARAIGLNVVSRRILWLKNWQADQKQRWKLASSPFKGTDLFGEALAPVLTETKDGKKKMSAGFRAADRKKTGSFRKQSFRNFEDQSSSNNRFASYKAGTSYRPDFYRHDFSHRQSRFQQGQFQSRQQQYGRKSNRNDRGRPFRRSK